MEPISDDELQRVRDDLQMLTENMLPVHTISCRRALAILARLDAAESRAADADRMRQRIDRLEGKLDAWHELYGSEDWRSVLAAEMEGDECQSA